MRRVAAVRIGHAVPAGRLPDEGDTTMIEQFDAPGSNARSLR